MINKRKWNNKNKKKNFISRFIIKIRELIKIIFSIWEKRISAIKYIILFIFGIIIFIIFYKYIPSLLLIIWINISFTISWTTFWNNDIVVCAIGIILFLAYDFLYLSPKRFHDRGRSREMSYYLTVQWTKWKNKYWEKPSFKKKIKEWWRKKY